MSTMTHLPVLASGNPRYRMLSRPDTASVQQISVIQPVTCISTFSEGKLPLPKGWREYVHAEGDTYYTHDERRIVTANDPRDPSVLDCLTQAHDAFKKALPRERLGQYELYLSITSSEKDGVMVAYYFADHSTRQLFWMNEAPLASLGIANASSLGEIKSRITPEYWTHIEYFPMHLPVRLEAEDELIGILRHGCVDNMTSPGSTFPFSEEECQKYLRIFEGFRSQDRGSTVSKADGYRNAVIARIWNAIARARHINSYGLARPRLDRLQGVAEFTHAQLRQSTMLRIAEVMCFSLSLQIFARLSEMWNGRVVYQRHWHIFFKDMRADWMRIAATSAVVWLGSVVLLASGTMNVPILVSIALSGSSTLVSLALCHKHREDILATGPDISRYIMSTENYWHGLRPLSIIFVVPHAMAAYSAASFGLALMTLAVRRAGSIFEAIGFGVAVLASAILPVYVVLSYFDPSLVVTIYIERILNPFKRLLPRALWPGGGKANEGQVSEVKND